MMLGPMTLPGCIVMWDRIRLMLQPISFGGITSHGTSHGLIVAVVTCGRRAGDAPWFSGWIFFEYVFRCAKANRSVKCT